LYTTINITDRTRDGYEIEVSKRNQKKIQKKFKRQFTYRTREEVLTSSYLLFYVFYFLEGARDER